MFTIYFHWINRTGFTRKESDTFDGAIAIARDRAVNKSNLMSVHIVDDDNKSMLISREELLRV